MVLELIYASIDHPSEDDSDDALNMLLGYAQMPEPKAQIDVTSDGVSGNHGFDEGFGIETWKRYLRR